ncbi:hypothetical protein [Roseibium sp.]|uniref:hypothetical protein n=1 Tax=Roseibium sp. TaxID=1936156 RepID=UPI003B5129FA
MSHRAIHHYVVLIFLVVGLNVFLYLFREDMTAFVAQWSDRRTEPEDRAIEEAAAPLITQLLTLPDIKSTLVSFEPTMRLEPPYKVVDSVSLRGKAQTEFKLAHVVGIGATDLCLNSKYGKFPCGLMGRASLQNRISNEPMTCIPVFYGDGARYFSCRLDDGTDLSAYQVGAGFARPDATGRLLLEEPLRRAKSLGAGAWQGDWSVLRLQDLMQTERIRSAPDERRLEAAEHD